MDLNGRFFSVSIFVEQPDAAYLVRRNLDPDGTLVKVDYNDLGRDHFILRMDPESGWKTTDGLVQRLPDPDETERLDEVVDLMNGLDPDRAVPAREARRAVTRYLLTHLHLPSTLNYLAARTLIMDWDTVLHNFYLYRGAGYQGQWRILPWDKSETFTYSRNPEFQATEPEHPFHGSWALYSTTTPPDDPTLVFNHLYDAVYQDPALRQMYLRRLRSVMDLLLGPPGAPVAAGPLAPAEIDLVLARMTDEILSNDVPRWEMTFAPEQVAAFLAARRTQLYDAAEFDGVIPGTYPAARNAVRFHAVAGPDSGEEPYLALINCSGTAVDLSGWSIRGDEERYTFAPGVVLPDVQGYLHTVYLASDAAATAATLQAADPDGLYWVLGDLDDGMLEDDGPLTLWDEAGRRVADDSHPLAACRYLYAPLIFAP